MFRPSLAFLFMVSVVACNGAPKVLASRAADPHAHFVPSQPSTATPACTSAGSLARWRYGLALARMESGNILAIGGHQHDSGMELADVESLDVATTTWSQAPSLLTPRALHVAITAASSHRIIVAGGNADSVEALDPSDDTWRVIGRAQGLGYSPYAFVAGDNAYVVGGDMLYKGVLSASAYAVSPSVEGIGALPSGRAAAALVLDGSSVWLVGGWKQDGTAPHEDLMFDGGTRLWTETRDARFDAVRHLEALGEVIWLEPTMHDLVVTTRDVYRFVDGACHSFTIIREAPPSVSSMAGS